MNIDHSRSTTVGLQSMVSLSKQWDTMGSLETPLARLIYSLRNITVITSLHIYYLSNACLSNL